MKDKLVDGQNPAPLRGKLTTPQPLLELLVPSPASYTSKGWLSRVLTLQRRPGAGVRSGVSSSLVLLLQGNGTPTRDISKLGPVTPSLNLFKIQLRAVRPWPRLPREAVAAPSLAGLKARLDGALSTLGWGKGSLLMAGGLEPDDLQGPSQPKPC